MIKFKVFLIPLLALAFSGPVSADEGEIRKELQMLRKRVEELEGKLDAVIGLETADGEGEEVKAVFGKIDGIMSA